MRRPIRFIALLLTLCLFNACGALLKPRSLNAPAPLRGELDTESQGDEVGGVLNDIEEGDELDGEDSENPEAEQSSGDAETTSDPQSAAEEGTTADEESETASNDSTPSSGSDTGASCLEIYSAIGECYYDYDSCVSNCQSNQCADECGDAYGACFENEVSLGSEQGQSDFNSLRTCEEQVYPGCYEDAIETWEECTDSCQDNECVDECSDEANMEYSDCMLEGCSDHYTTCGLI